LNNENCEDWGGALVGTQPAGRPRVRVSPLGESKRVTWNDVVMVSECIIADSSGRYSEIIFGKLPLSFASEDSEQTRKKTRSLQRLPELKFDFRTSNIPHLTIPLLPTL
jgi:hypothetical protein